jgi:hypothetical protein
MSAVNAKKFGAAAPANAWAGAMARIRRRGATSRAGRRSVMLGVLSSMQTTSRKGANASPRGSSEA